MGRYTLKGSPELDGLIEAHMARIAEEVQSSRHAALYRALILIGGYGRGEGTPYLVEGRQVPFNDYDLVVVSSPLSRSRRAEVQRDLRTCEESLSRELKLPVDLCLYPLNVLRQAEFSLLNYEMKYGHRIVWGEADVIRHMPAYEHDRIPLSEGTRLLMNRGKLLLDVRRALRDQVTFTGEERIRCIKFLFKALLAFGDCTLLANGAYDISYTVKQERIARFAGSDVPDPEFMIAGFRRAIAFKEWGDFSSLGADDWRAEFEQVRRYYVRFFRWYEGKRLGAPVVTSEAYRAALGAAGRECGLLKAVLLNLRLFGARAFQFGGGLLTVHPRARLYLALPMLLGDTVPLEGLRQVLAVPVAGIEGVESRFYALQKRIS